MVITFITTSARSRELNFFKFSSGETNLHSARITSNYNHREVEVTKLRMLFSENSSNYDYHAVRENYVFFFLFFFF